MSHETQETVNTWAVETFGDGGTHLQCAARANEEMAELLTCLSGPNPDLEAVAEELADVCIVLYRLGTRLEVELPIRRLTARPGLAAARHYAAQANKLLSDVLADLCFKQGYHLAVPSVYTVWQDLRCVAVALGVDLHAAIDAKMAVNRQRKWTVDGSGHGAHTKGGVV